MTDEQTPDPHAALRAGLRALSTQEVRDYPLDAVRLAHAAADALVQEKARADAAEQRATEEIEAGIALSHRMIDAYSKHKARADVAEKGRDEFKRLFSECHPVHLDGVIRAQKAEARADRLADIVQNVVDLGNEYVQNPLSATQPGIDFLYCVPEDLGGRAQAESEGLLR